MTNRPNTRPFLRHQEDALLPAGTLTYGILTALNALWKREDNLPLRGSESFRVSAFSPINIVTRFTPAHPSTSLPLQQATWGLADVLNEVVISQRWRAATFDLKDLRTGQIVAVINIFDERHPPRIQPLLEAAQNQTDTTAIESLVDEKTLTANERLTVFTTFDTALTLNRHRVYELYLRGMFWVVAHRASASVRREYDPRNGITLGMGDLEILFVLTDLGDNKHGWLTWAQVGDAFRGLMHGAIVRGEAEGYHPIEALFMRDVDRKRMVMVKYRERRRPLTA